MAGTTTAIVSALQLLVLAGAQWTDGTGAVQDDVDEGARSATSDESLRSKWWPSPVATLVVYALVYLALRSRCATGSADRSCAGGPPQGAVQYIAQSMFRNVGFLPNSGHAWSKATRIR